MTIEKSGSTVEELTPFEDPFERFAHAIDRAKGLEPLSDEYKIDTFRSRVVSRNFGSFLPPKRKCYFGADSDASITKGTAGLLCELYSGETPENIIALEPDFSPR